MKKETKANLTANSKKLPRGATYPEGRSGNPSGRPKRTPEELDLIAACKDKTPGALAVIESVMNDAGGNPKNRLMAAQYIIDRGYGKAQQAVTISGDAENPIALLIQQISGTALPVVK